jgi:hypothetical protein
MGPQQVLVGSSLASTSLDYTNFYNNGKSPLWDEIATNLD